MEKRGLILGGMGATGQALIRELLERNTLFHIDVVVREDPGPEFLEQFITKKTVTTAAIKVVDFTALKETYENYFKQIDVAYSCLGATKFNKEEGYSKVDHDYVLLAATILKEHGCEEFHLISTFHAHKDSRLLYYRTKGLIEEDLTKLGFKHLLIYRPFLMKSNRKSDSVLMFLFRKLMVILDPYHFITVPVDMVAKAMVVCTLSPCNNEVETINQNDIQVLANMK